MIFVSVGTHEQQFDRLLLEIDLLVKDGKIVENIFAQIGNSKYKPRNFDWTSFLTLGQFKSMLSNASVFITHAGEGNVGLAKTLGKKFVVIPRRVEFGEHTDNHQLELARVVEEKGLGLVAWNPSDLWKKIGKIGSFEPAKIEKGNIPRIIESFLEKQ